MKLMLLLILVLALFVGIGCRGDYDPVIRHETLPPHVQQVQDDQFIAPLKYSGELHYVCRDPNDTDEFWYLRVDYDETPGWVNVNCADPQEFVGP